MSSEWLSSDLSAQIRNEYPSCVAAPCARLEGLHTSVTRDPKKILDAAITLFDISLKTVCFCCASDLVEQGLVSEQDALLGYLRELETIGAGLSTGTALHMLNACLKLGRGAQVGFTQEFSQKLTAAGFNSLAKAGLDRLCAVRNDEAHGHMKAEAVYEETLREPLPLLARWLDLLGVFRDWSFVVHQSTLHRERSRSLHDGLLLTGNRYEPERHVFESEAVLARGTLLVARTSSLRRGALEDGSFFRFAPLVIVPDDAAPPEMYFYRKATGTTIEYLGAFTSRKHHADPADLRNWVAGISADDGGSTTRPVAGMAHLRRACRDATCDFVKDARARGIYHETAYAERRDVQVALGAFWDSKLPCCFLIAPSGGGKTSLLAHLGARSPRDGTPLLAIFAADGLPDHGDDLAKFFAARLDVVGTDFKSFVERVEHAARRLPDFRCAIVIDGVDRHADPRRLMSAIVTLARTLHGCPHVRLVASCTSSVLESYARSCGKLDPALFYRPSYGLVEGAAGEPPGIAFGPLRADELDHAFRAYRGQDSSAAETGVPEELSDDLRSVFSHPLILRIAMDVYRGRPLPSRLFVTSLLREFTDKHVFSDPRRHDFVADLIDLMIAQRSRTISFEKLRKAPRLRQAILGPDAVLEQLFAELLLRRSTPGPGGDAPFAPCWHVEFTFDLVLEYMIFWRISMSADDTEQGLQRLWDLSQEFPAARGALMLMCVWLVRQRNIAPLVRLFESRAEPWADELWREFFTATAQAGEIEVGPQHLLDLFSAFAARAPDRAVAITSDSAERLFAGGALLACHALLAMTMSVETIDPDQRTRQLNRCVLIEKNRDQWLAARRTSDRCLELLGGDSPPDLRGAVLVNRSSVLYDLGPRRDVRPLLEEARDLAGVSPLVRAAAENNLALYHLFRDELEVAENLFRSAAERVPARTAPRAYVHTNLALTLLSKQRASGGSRDEARGYCEEALAVFQALGHRQGASYASNNRGIFQLLDRNFDDARSCFARTRHLAACVGEVWSEYGARLNEGYLALELGDERKALELAEGSREQARANNDSKGIADAGLVAAAAALRLLQKGTAVWNADQLRASLDETRRTFAALEQPLGQAMALWGLRELASIAGGRVDHPDGRELLRHTSYAGLPPEFRPLPCYLFLLMEVF